MNLFKRSASDIYYTRFMVRGKVYQWSTKTGYLPLAKRRAKEYREAIEAEEFGVVSRMKARGDAPTFGELFAAYRGLLSPSDATRERGIKSLKQMLALSGLGEDDRLFKLDREVAEKWLREAPCGKRSRNSAFRKAKALFSTAALASYPKDLHLKLEGVFAFRSVPFLKTGELVIELPTDEEVRTALEKLEPGPEKNAFVLCAFCGLRSGEAIAARWDWIKGGVILVGGTDAFTAKSGKYRTVKLDPVVEVMLLRGEHDMICGDFPLLNVQRRLPQKLRELGWSYKKPIHSLRRWFGSKVAASQGLWAAKNALGHSSYRVTETAYARLVETPLPVSVPASVPGV